MYIWLDPQSYGFGFGYSSLWSLAGLVHAPSGGRPSSLLAAGYSSLRGTCLHRPLHKERGTVFAIKYSPNNINRFASLTVRVAMEGA
jgi:hypothetical protein